VGVSGCERAGARRFRPPGRRCWAAPAASAQVLGDLRESIPLLRSPAIRGKEDFWARARWATRSRQSLPPMGVVPRPGATDASMRRASEARRRLGGSSASTRRRGARDISKLQFLIFPALCDMGEFRSVATAWPLLVRSLTYRFLVSSISFDVGGLLFFCRAYCILWQFEWNPIRRNGGALYL
jgi:hypothetical protein